jgi:hypothetical protein
MRIRSAAILAAVLAAFVTLVVIQSPTRLTVVVKDPGGTAIPSAFVHVQHWAISAGNKPRMFQDAAGTTASNGSVTFELSPAEGYEVSVSAQAFNPAVASVDVTKGHDTQQVFSLTPRQATYKGK